MPTNSPGPTDPETDPSRRDFLGKVAVGGAAILAVTETRADEPSKPSPTADGRISLTLNVNGKPRPLQVDPRVTLLDALREHLGLTGSKKSCDAGACGACTVLADGKRINSCLTLAVMSEGKNITTVEGLADGENLHPLQAAFIKHDGFQCGYCTPGQLCSAVALLTENVAKTPGEIREWMSGNLCRCGAYPNIVAAVLEVIGEERK